MNLRTLLKEIEVQGYYEVVYYDEEKEERIPIENNEAAYDFDDCEVNFLYCENDILYIEVEEPT